MEFAAKVRNLLEARNLTQVKLAATIGTSQTVVSRWLEGNKPPKATYLLRLARTLDVTVDYLIDDSMREMPSGQELSDDERAIIDVFRALRLDRHEAIRRLAGKMTPASQPQPEHSQTGVAVDPATGRVLPPESDRPSRRRHTAG